MQTASSRSKIAGLTLRETEQKEFVKVKVEINL